LACEDQDRQQARGRVVLESVADFKAAQVGHVQVEQDEVGLALGNSVERLLAVPGEGNLLAVAGKQRLEQRRNARFIIDHQDLGASPLVHGCRSALSEGDRGCAARPTAAISNPFGGKTSSQHVCRTLSLYPGRGEQLLPLALGNCRR